MKSVQMAISKTQKTELIAQYKKNLQEAKTVVVLKQFGVPVNTCNAIRRNLTTIGTKYCVVRKKLFLKAIEGTEYSAIEHGDLEGSVVVLFSSTGDYADLKVIAKSLKEFKKLQATYGFDYVGGRFENQRKGGDFVKELANLPSKEELVGKLLYLLKFPLQSLTGTLDQIAKKQS